MTTQSKSGERSTPRIRQPAAPALFDVALWPLAAALAANAAALSYLDEYRRILTDGRARRRHRPVPDWATPNRIALDLQSMRLRDFSRAGEGTPTLICAPFALHGATVADFAPGHSLVETLRDAGLGRVFVTDWRSATPELCNLAIDNYLAELNVAVDELGPPVDLIGLCQGGWLALVYAARFPRKIRRLVIAGAPVDVRAADSALSRIADDVPLAVFEELVQTGDGRLLGERALDAWPSVPASREAVDILQTPADLDASELRNLLDRFRTWNAWTVDLPGPYFLQVVQWVFKENRIAQGKFMALGRTADLREIRSPTYLLGARDDKLVAPDQLLAAAHLLGTARHDIASAIEPGEHLSLFLGAETLRNRWEKIARWLLDDRPLQGQKRHDARPTADAHKEQPQRSGQNVGAGQAAFGGNGDAWHETSGPSRPRQH